MLYLYKNKICEVYLQKFEQNIEWKKIFKWKLFSQKPQPSTFASTILISFSLHIHTAAKDIPYIGVFITMSNTILWSS